MVNYLCTYKGYRLSISGLNGSWALSAEPLKPELPILRITQLL
jgi:hypothetical protein